MGDHELAAARRSSSWTNCPELGLNEALMRQAKRASHTANVCHLGVCYSTVGGGKSKQGVHELPAFLVLANLGKLVSQPEVVYTGR